MFKLFVFLVLAYLVAYYLRLLISALIVVIHDNTGHEKKESKPYSSSLNDANIKLRLNELEMKVDLLHDLFYNGDALDDEDDGTIVDILERHDKAIQNLLNNISMIHEWNKAKDDYIHKSTNAANAISDVVQKHEETLSNLIDVLNHHNDAIENLGTRTKELQENLDLRAGLIGEDDVELWHYIQSDGTYRTFCINPKTYKRDELDMRAAKHSDDGSTTYSIPVIDENKDEAAE